MASVEHGAVTCLVKSEGKEHLIEAIRSAHTDTPSRQARSRGPRAPPLPACGPHGAAADSRAPYPRRAPAPEAAVLIDHDPIRALTPRHSPVPKTKRHSNSRSRQRQSGRLCSESVRSTTRLDVLPARRPPSLRVPSRTASSASTTCNRVDATCDGTRCTPHGRNRIRQRLGEQQSTIVGHRLTDEQAGIYSIYRQYISV